MTLRFDDNMKSLSEERPDRRQALKAIGGGLQYLLVVLVSVLALAPQSGHASQVEAASLRSYMFTVNTTADTHDAQPGDGMCADSSGQCSLRAAIEEADAVPPGSLITITVPAGTYGLTLGTLGLTGHHSITINGASRKTTIISGNHTFTIMGISGGVSASLNQLTIEGGAATTGGGIFNRGTLTVISSSIRSNLAYCGGYYSSCFGGGIYNTGTLSVSTSTLSGNKVRGGCCANNFGGGIYNTGTLSVSTSTLSGNKAGGGGGISNDGGMLSVSSSTFSNNVAHHFGGYTIYNGGGIENRGTLSVSTSTFSGNKADQDGGGIWNKSNSTVTVSNSTFSGNSAPDGGYIGNGGGISNDGGTLSVSNSTLSGNKADYGGGGIFNYYGPVTLTGTIVANSPSGANCYGTITEGVGYNVDSGSSCGFSLSTDLNKTDPMLGPLGDNGGPTQTMELLQGSPAIDWVAASSCPTTDQRGYVRPDNGESMCDIGAYESTY